MTQDKVAGRVESLKRRGALLVSIDDLIVFLDSQSDASRIKGADCLYFSETQTRPSMKFDLQESDLRINNRSRLKEIIKSASDDAYPGEQCFFEILSQR